MKKENRKILSLFLLFLTLGYNQNYATLALKCTLKSSKGTLLVSEINRRYRNNNIENN